MGAFSLSLTWFSFLLLEVPLLSVCKEENSPGHQDTRISSLDQEEPEPPLIKEEEEEEEVLVAPDEENGRTRGLTPSGNF